MIRFLFLLALLLPGFAAWSAEPRIQLLLGGDSAPYQGFARTFEAVAEGRVLSGGDNVAGTTLLVAVGQRGLEQALAIPALPILAAMVPQDEFIQMQPRLVGRSVSALYIDQPWQRQMQFIRASLPQVKSVGVIYTFAHASLLPDMERAARGTGLKLVPAQVRTPDTLFETLDGVLEKSDALLVLPDASIYNAGSIRNILLTSYRRRIPLLGVSAGLVRAGAYGAVYSTPEQLARQAAAMVANFAATGRLPDNQYPQQFEILLNSQVARSLGLDRVDERAVRAELGREGQP